MSARDKKLLIILAGIAVLALTYFFVFAPQANKRETLKTENMQLKSQYNQLSTLAAKADDYTKKTQKMSDEMQKVYDNFPSYLQIENGIMDAVAIEKSTNTKFTELTVNDPVAIDVTADNSGDGTEQSSGSSDSSSSADTTATDNGSGSDATAQNNAKSTVAGYQLYDVNSAMSFTTEYHGLKTMLSELIDSSNKKTISTLNVSYDESTGKVSGEMQMDSYFLYGLDKPYEPPVIPSVPHGTTNLFGTTN